MKNILFACACIFLIINSLSAKEIKYPVADISKELKENARSVYRSEETVFQINSLNSAKLTVTYAVTVLNKNGIDDAIFNQPYDHFSKISGIKGRIYDEQGNLIRKISSEDIIDHSAISGVYEDRRVKYIKPEFLNVPFTVEYSYEKTYDGLYGCPSWYPQQDYNVSIEKSSYKVIAPKNLEFRFKEYHTPTKGTYAEDAENKTYYWEAKNLKALEREPFSSSFLDMVPYVVTTPSEFEHAGYTGNLSTWKNIGIWANSLINENDQLPDETLKNLKDLVANSTDDLDKVRKIYEYMQNRTRFVSVQVGIGGLKPLDASTVNRLGYGDCKALSNYTKVLLKAVNINSKNCWVSSGNDAHEIDTSFPNDQFNHVILCVPLNHDTLWLECTNQRMPCGFIGTFTDDRDVLIVDGDQSRLVHTKAYYMDDNKETRTSRVKLDQDGTGEVEINAIYKGLNYEGILPVFWADNSDKKKIISESIKFPSFQLKKFSYKNNKEIIPSMEENLQIDFENYLSSIGSRRFLTINFANRIENSPGNVRNRKTDVLVRRPYIDIDTIVYQLPATLKPETVPSPVEIKTQFGEYHASVQYKENQLVYIRTFQMNKGRYPATAYADFVDFFDKVSVADNVKCALVQNN